MEKLLLAQFVNFLNNNHKKNNIANLSDVEILDYYKNYLKKYNFNSEYKNANIEYGKIENLYENLNLSYMYCKAKKETDKWVVGVHGYSSSKELVFLMMEHYWKKGYNILTFDLRNHGKSDASYISLGVNEVTDLETILNWMNNRFSISEIGVVGFSMGAHTINVFNLLNKNNKYNCKWYISDSTYLDRIEIINNLSKTYFPIDDLNDKLIDTIKNFYQNDLSIDLLKNSITSELNDCYETSPTLFICSETDMITKSIDSEKIYELRKAKTDKDEILILKDADHTKGCLQSPIEYFNAVDKFIKGVK